MATQPADAQVPRYSVASHLIDDLQATPDTRGITIDRAGVCDLKYPIRVDHGSGTQQTIADVSLAVEVHAEERGTHMSRFIEFFDAQQEAISPGTLGELLKVLAHRLGANACSIDMRFPLFLRRYAPATNANALMDYDCTMHGSLEQRSVRISIGATVPIASVCPCSKAISDYGAHNQRGYIKMEVELSGSASWMAYDELIDIAESSGSAPVFPLVKRPDERYVTMFAYDNPQFVEDIARNVAGALKDDQRIKRLCVDVKNIESIHNHGAFARIGF